MATLTAYPLLALVALAVVVVAFFIGAVNPASIIAKVLGKDLSQGSGNPGATNAGRVMGRKWGVLVGVLDVCKGVLPVWIVGVTLGLHLAYLAGVAAVLGHIFSPFLRGRGGKGVATALGAVLAVHPLGALALVVIFGVVFALSRWVALASVAAALGLIGLGIAAGAGATWFGGNGWGTGGWAIGLGLLIIVRHRRNAADLPKRFPQGSTG